MCSDGDYEKATQKEMAERFSLMMRFLLGRLPQTMADEKVINSRPPCLVCFFVIAYDLTIGRDNTEGINYDFRDPHGFVQS